ncbi:hypothetical protein EON63_00560, partial [archaeon]
MLSPTKMQVNCFLHVPHMNAPLCSYYIDNADSAAAEIVRYFPYDGSFHFRVKVSGRALGMQDTEFLWLDLPADLGPGHRALDKSLDLSRLMATPHSEALEVQVTPTEIFKADFSEDTLFCELVGERDVYLQQVAAEAAGSSADQRRRLGETRQTA